LLLAVAAAAPVSAQDIREVSVERNIAFTQPSCVAAEQVVLTGTVRHRFQVNFDGSGGVHIHDYYSAHGRGTGYVALLQPVASYVASDEQLQSTNLTSGSSSTVVFNTRVVRLGESVTADDLILKSRVHFTMNANGVVTADFADETAECK
jgi:hypothetical protein